LVVSYAAESDGDGEGILEQRLQPGRHGLDRESVRAHQHRRLLAATALAVLEVGYGSLTVGEITRRAGVSRVTFYQLFEGKAAVLTAAFDDAFEALRESICSACAKHSRWPDNAIAGVHAAISFAVERPAQAGLLGSAAVGLEPELAASLRASNARLAAMLRAARPSEARGEVPLPAIAEETLVGGLSWVIAGELAGGRSAELAELAPELAQVMLVPYLGAAAARHLAPGSLSAPA
jgi:AcrR family transcriptional regulator